MTTMAAGQRQQWQLDNNNNGSWTMTTMAAGQQQQRQLDGG
jgi:hypothetical protein